MPATPRRRDDPHRPLSEPGENVHRMIVFADQLHARVRGIRLLGWFAWGVRVLLAAAFLPSGLTKVLGLPFTRLDPDTSDVGRMFAELQHDFGGLYPFIGACQLAAAVLLLVPRTVLVGALVHLPITAGITVITTTVGFRGTWLIAWLMLLGVTFLICWDWHRVKALCGPELPPERRLRRTPLGDDRVDEGDRGGRQPAARGERRRGQPERRISRPA